MQQLAAIALIVAAGRGTRADPTGRAPKQYAALGDRTVLAHAVAAFLEHPSIDAVQVVIHRDDRAAYDGAIACLSPSPRLAPPVIGGATRQQSVLAGLEALEAAGPTHVLIHDAARPFVPHDVINRVLAALVDKAAAIAALPLADTLKRAGANNTIAATVPRGGLWRAQTPQGFGFADILKAHRSAAAAGAPDFTDDAAIAEWAGLAVRLVVGDERAGKITTQEDLRMTERQQHAATAPLNIRIGQGFDVHSFTSGDHVMLCGVRVPHTHGVEAHSDGDVALHALTDALLGAIADGDIGQHFRNTDPRWRGASSDQFLEDAVKRIAAQGGEIVNVDVTVLSEAPKIAPHRDAMRQRLASLLRIDVGRVALKATTTEKLGALGRREGLAALAIALVHLR